MSNTVADAELYTESLGEGEPLVLLHGWSMNLRVFDELRQGLAAHHRVIALDLPGHGRSPWVPGRGTFTQQLQRLGAHLPTGATLVGWSLGGQFAMALAAQPAHRVRRLVLISSTPRFLASPDWPHGLSAATLAHFAQALDSDAAAVVADFLELQVRGSRHAAASAAALRAALATHGMARPEALRAGLQLLRDNDLRVRSLALQVPTLLISGQYDRITPPAASQALEQLMPQAQRCELPRAGHAPFLSHRSEVLAAMLRFLAEPPRASAPDTRSVDEARSGTRS